MAVAEMRMQMTEKIMAFLQQRKPMAAKTRLQEIAIRLEGHLWKRAAGDIDEYNDLNTLKHRLVLLARTLEQRQKRLLSLRHAFKCQHVDGSCPQKYPSCKGMKELWRHVVSCREKCCQYPHCVSSCHVLSHYSKCKDELCATCAPVRNTIRSTRGPQAQQGGAGMSAMQSDGRRRSPRSVPRVDYNASAHPYRRAHTSK